MRTPPPASRSPALAAAPSPHRPAAPDRPIRQRGVPGLRRDRARRYLPALRPARERDPPSAPDAPSAPPQQARQSNPHCRRPAGRGDDPPDGSRTALPRQAAAADRLRHRPGGHRGGRHRDRLAHRRPGATPAAHDHRRRPADLRQQPARAAGPARTRRRAQGTRRHPRQPVRAAATSTSTPGCPRSQSRRAGSSA